MENAATTHIVRDLYYSLGCAQAAPLGPRACALPAADTAQAQCVPRSAGSKPAPTGAATAGHRKRRRWHAAGVTDEG